MKAWYCPGAFDIASGTWRDCSGNGNTATLSGSGLVELRNAGHGATNKVRALSGTTSSVIAFGPVIKSEFTICSVTRYTGGTKGRILQGSTNWLHGHRGGNAGVAHYEGWKTAQQDNVSPDTDWVVSGSNAGSQAEAGERSRPWHRYEPPSMSTFRFLINWVSFSGKSLGNHAFGNT